LHPKGVEISLRERAGGCYLFVQRNNSCKATGSSVSYLADLVPFVWFQSSPNRSLPDPKGSSEREQQKPQVYDGLGRCGHDRRGTESMVGERIPGDATQTVANRLLGFLLIEAFGFWGSGVPGIPAGSSNLIQKPTKISTGNQF